MKFFFGFGYHGLDGWEGVKDDPYFDFESSGSLVIISENGGFAEEWGKVVAKWYLDKLHKDTSDYKWDSKNYATWVSKLCPEGELESEIPKVNVGAYPNYQAMREYQND